MRAIFLIIFSALLFTSCSKKLIEAETGETFYLKYHQSAEVKDNASGEILKVKFDELEEDSRCPEGAVCVWSGQVIVRLSINSTDVHTGMLGNTSDGEYEDCSIILMSVEPHPEIDKSYKKEKYVIGLRIDKK